MTAIFAYAADQIAFVAGDTHRVARNGLVRGVTKVHHWSDRVVFAQAGEADFLGQLIGNVLPCMGFYAPSLDGFFEAFEQLRPVFWRKAEDQYADRKAGPVPQGVILAASAAVGSVPAAIYKIDFQSGQKTVCSLPIDAEGTDPVQFKTDADHAFAHLKRADMTVPLDSWAALSVAAASGRYPQAIRLPADALIARPSPEAEGRILVHRRLDNNSKPLELFKTLP